MRVTIADYVELTSLRPVSSLSKFVMQLEGRQFAEYLRIEAAQWQQNIARLGGDVDNPRIAGFVSELRRVADLVNDHNLEAMRGLYLSTRNLAVTAIQGANGQTEYFKGKSRRKQRGQSANYQEARDWLWWAVFFHDEPLDSKKAKREFLERLKQLLTDNNIAQPTDEGNLGSKQMPHIEPQVREVRQKLWYAQFDPDYVELALPSESVWLFMAVRDADVLPRRTKNIDDPNEVVRAFIAAGDEYLLALRNCQYKTARTK